MHHVGVVVKRLRVAAETAAHERERQYHFGPNGEKNTSKENPFMSVQRLFKV